MIREIQQQTIVKEVMDVSVVSDLSMLKRLGDFLKRELKQAQEDLYKLPTDLKKQINFQLKEDFKKQETGFAQQLQALQLKLQNEFTDALAAALQSFQPKAAEGGGEEKAGEKPPEVKKVKTSAKEVDEAEIKKIINQNIHRVSMNLQS